MILRTVTKTVSIDVPPGEVFAFLANASNWPRRAIVNLMSITQLDGEWWEMQFEKTPVTKRPIAKA